MNRRHALQNFGALLLAFQFSASFAQSFPDNPVRTVVPFAPSNTLDTALHQAAEEVKKNTGQPLLVGNNPGGSDVIAAQNVMATTRAGHTLLLADTSTLAINPHTFNKLPYDPEKALRPVSNFLSGSMLIAVHECVPANNVKEFVDDTKVLEVTSQQRSPLIPNVATFREQGDPDLDTSRWAAIGAPAAVPDVVIYRLNSEFRKALRSAEIEEKWRPMDFEPQPSPTEEFTKFAKANSRRWADMVKIPGFRVAE